MCARPTLSVQILKSDSEETYAPHTTIHLKAKRVIEPCLWSFGGDCHLPAVSPLRHGCPNLSRPAPLNPRAARCRCGLGEAKLPQSH